MWVRVEQSTQETTATAADINHAPKAAEVNAGDNGLVAGGADAGHTLFEGSGRVRVRGQVVPEATAVGGDKAGLPSLESMGQVSVGIPAPRLRRNDRVTPQGAGDVSTQQVAERRQTVAAVLAETEQADVPRSLQEAGKGTFVCRQDAQLTRRLWPGPPPGHRPPRHGRAPQLQRLLGSRQ